jgi:hypothetical protein
MGSIGGGVKWAALKAFGRDFNGRIWPARPGLARNGWGWRGVAFVNSDVETALLELFFHIDFAGILERQKTGAHPADFVSAHGALGNVDGGSGKMGTHDVAFRRCRVAVDPNETLLVGHGPHGGAYLKRAMEFRCMGLREVG